LGTKIDEKKNATNASHRLTSKKFSREVRLPLARNGRVFGDSPPVSKEKTSTFLGRSPRSKMQKLGPKPFGVTLKNKANDGNYNAAGNRTD